MTWRTCIMIISWEAQILFSDWYRVFLCKSVQQIILKYDSAAETIQDLSRHWEPILHINKKKKHLLFHQDTYMFKLVMSLQLFF